MPAPASCENCTVITVEGNLQKWMCSIGKENVLVYFKGDLNGYLTILQALPIDWLVGWLIDWLIDWLIGWLFDWLTDWLIDWLGDWLVGWNYLLTLGILGKFREMEPTQKRSISMVSFSALCKYNFDKIYTEIWNWFILNNAEHTEGLPWKYFGLNEVMGCWWSSN